MPALTLSRDELMELSGRQRPDAIRRWLDRQRIPYLDGADGWPRVLMAIIEARMGLKSPAPPPKREPRMRLL